jgi:predicted AlkP superfamily phosphohydrolase/phosphomutase
VWSEGGYYARVFFNVKGREPHGVIDPADYERFRDEIKAKFEATMDDQGRHLCTRVYKPDEIYCAARNVAPDLIVHFGDLYWRSIGGVGYGAVHVQENDTGPDDCNHAQHGEISGVTGIDDPYEPPTQAEIRLDTESSLPEENARLVLEYLAERGFVRAERQVAFTRRLLHQPTNLYPRP